MTVLLTEIDPITKTTCNMSGAMKHTKVTGKHIIIFYRFYRRWGVNQFFKSLKFYLENTHSTTLYTKVTGKHIIIFYRFYRGWGVKRWVFKKFSTWKIHIPPHFCCQIPVCGEPTVSVSLFAIHRKDTVSVICLQQTFKIPLKCNRVHVIHKSPTATRMAEHLNAMESATERDNWLPLIM